jgi:hypothetical protein
LLGGDALGRFQGPWRAVYQQSQVGVADIDQPRAYGLSLSGG